MTIILGIVAGLIAFAIGGLWYGVIFSVMLGFRLPASIWNRLKQPTRRDKRDKMKW